MTMPGAQLRVVLGVSRARVLPLRVAYQGHDHIRVIASCAAASEVLSLLENGEADGAILEEDLHGLDRGRLALLKERRSPVVLLSRRLEAPQWQGLAGPVLPLETDPADILLALRRAVQGEYAPRRPSRRPVCAAGPSTTEPPAQHEPATTAAQFARDSLPLQLKLQHELQVIGWWSGRGAPGKTTLGFNTLALGGAVEPTVLVELDTTAASLAAYLDDGRDGRPRRARSTLLELAGAQLRSSEDWEQALNRTLQPLGPYSPHARLLPGIAHPERRTKLVEPTAFVESLVGELRRRFARVLLDVGSDPLGGESTEACIGTAALRLADWVLVVATPEPASVHRACMAMREAGDRLDRERASLVVNRVDPKQHGDVSWISDAVGLPILATLPADDRAQQRSLAAAVPVVRDPDSCLRRPLAQLLEQLGTAPTVNSFVPAPRRSRQVPLWGQLRTAATFILSTFGGPR
jgi:MinD-like ATPase involved in chromosome partitioning or flagellar assembly